MSQQWEKIREKLEAMSVRERVLIFAAAAFLIVSLLNYFLLEPFMLRQKALRGQLAQQQQMLQQVQSQVVALNQANSPDATSPLHQKIKQLKLELAEGNAYLKSNRERLVQPEKMAEHLQQLLNRNSRLQLVALQTLPVSPLIEQQEAVSLTQKQTEKNTATAVSISVLDKQVFKHGVQLTLRGNYLDLLQYLHALEKLPQQMYWAKAQLSVVQFPSSDLSLTLYTLSLDKTWLQI